MRPGLVLVVLAASMLALAGCQGASTEVFQHSFNQPLRLDGGRSIGQSFQVRSGRVAGVDVLMATFGEQPSGTLVVELRDEPGGRTLASVDLAASELANNEWAAARFGSAVEVGDEAVVALDWQGEGPVAVWANVPLDEADGDGLLNDPYQGGQRLVAGEPATGDLAFRVVGPGGAGPQLSLVADVARQGLARLVEAPLFAFAWLLLLIGAVGLAVWGLAPSTRRLGQGRPDDQGGEHEERAAS